ncbi:YIP1 family protein [Paenibacillus mendelii]|uniref:YIP1 family protein n=1 Tax=Paenibacillus mendelii TaxID=206163 RepID=A0ABV6JLZ5_9BACL|nr:NHL repeat-containing protein [Paenibacillus mendelii]MCQ6558746.1 NHL repeat-containing protein [Paenibacillus mendelii]
MPLVRRIMVLIGLCCLFFPAVVSAALPYQTEYVIPDTGGSDAWSTQPLYTPRMIVTGRGEGGMGEGMLAFAEPNDLFIAANDTVYVADTGNNRIVILHADGSFASQLGLDEGEGSLNAPEGVFVTADGIVYVADTGNERIAVFDASGKFIRAYEKPDSSMLPEAYFYVPHKVVVDARGTMYVVSKGSYQGIVRMNEAGQFTGFFGANKASLTFTQQVQRWVLSAEQLKKEKAARPGEVANVTIDMDGFLLTSNFGVFSGQIKRLNAGGIDMLRGKSFRDLDQLVDTAIDSNGFLYSISRSPLNTIGVYDPQGTALFRFGGMSADTQRFGLFRFPTAIALNSKQELWVADSKLGTVQIFERTEFGSAVLEAMSLSDKGYYADSEPYWERTIEMNEMIDAGYRGLGEAAIYRGAYADAIGYFKQGKDAKGYSEAFWDVRLGWIRQYLFYAVLLAAACWFVLAFVLRRTRSYTGRADRQTKIAVYRQEWRDFGYLLLHPYEGFYRLKERRISPVTIGTILVLVVVLSVCQTYATGFAFNPLPPELRNPIWPVLILLGGWLTWVIANYLVSTVKDGEGRLREVLQASTFAFAPYIVFMVGALSRADKRYCT